VGRTPIGCFTAFFQEERNIGDLEVLTEVGEELGFDRQALRTALQTGQYHDRHRAALRHAYEEMHITAVPTFLMDGRMLRGLPSPSQLTVFLAG
jgi:predicted DsbA family dithiol-disulfide isomerase